MRRNIIGLQWLFMAIIISIVMMVANYISGPEFTVSADLGICLPSPNVWPVDRGIGPLITDLLILSGIPLIVFFNKRFNIVQGADMVFPAMYAILASSNCFITSYASASPLLMIAVTTSLWIMFNIKGERNAPQAYFSLATLIGIGSMIQYAFIPLGIALLLCGIVMKTLRIKEIIAYLLGIIAPYWVGVGLGLIPLTRFHLPELNNMLQNIGDKTELFALILYSGLLFLATTLLCMNHAIRLYAGNSNIRRMNNCINVVGITAALCMLFDYNNMMAYMDTLYFWMAVQIGNLFALNRIIRPQIIMGVIIAIIISVFLVFSF